MREIDVAHQAEDQREAARDQEIKAAEGDPVEAALRKSFFLPNTASKPGGHGAKTSQIKAMTTTTMIRDQIGRRAMKLFIRHHS